MCDWSDRQRDVFERVVRALDGQAFDAHLVRDRMREETTDSILYGDVFSELWHAYRKRRGPFASMRQYVIRTTVCAAGTVVAEYVPAEGTVLKKVLRRWGRG